MKAAICHCLKSCRALPAVVACSLSFACTQAVSAATYNVIDLGTLGGTSSQALGINNAGQIVGYAITSSNQQHAAYWANSSSPAIDLGTLGGTFGEAIAINPSGEMIGDATTSGDAHDDPAVWTNSSSGAINLGGLGGTNGGAQGINTSGQIVGYAYTTNNLQHAAFWNNRSGPAIDLGTLGGSSSVAFGINVSGQIVGDANTTSNNSHAAYWPNSSSEPVDLGTLGGTLSDAYAVNNLGQIVGDAYTAGDAAYHATLWTNSSSGLIDLGTLGGAYGQALGINAASQIVGTASTSNGTFHAAFWTVGTNSALDLNSLIPMNSGWVLQQANAINDSGEIVGFGTIGGQTHAFALVPASSPSISAPVHVSVWIASTNVFLAFPTVTNLLYDVQSRTDLVSGAWSTMTSNLMGTGGVVTNRDVGGATVSKRFFRVGAHS
jgi:probable HAF family extracellular repeat protein